MINGHKLLPNARQRGIALFISLVLLLVLTIIGVSAVQTTTLETRMARNEHDLMLAFQAAESALRDAETQIEGVLTTAVFTNAGSDGLWSRPEFETTERWLDDTVWEDGSVEAATDPGAVVAASPRYFIEHMASVLREENAYQLSDPYAFSSADRIEIFRITALGTGGSDRARVLLQATYGRVLD